MDDIVGSQKYWTTKWSLFKRNLLLNQRQKSLIIGSLLGDGTLRIGQGAVNANFKVEHGLQQKELVFWKYKILKPWVSTEPKISYRYDSNDGKYAKSWWFRTVRHPELLKLRSEFYKNGIKVVPNNIVKLIDKLVELFSKKFGIVAKYFEDRDKGYRMYFGVIETEKLVVLIRPFIIPSMMYKVGYFNSGPVKTSLQQERYNF